MFLQHEELFKERNTRQPPSQHYIYIPEKVECAEEAGIDEDWARKHVFEKIIHEICLSDEERAKQRWIDHEYSILKKSCKPKLDAITKEKSYLSFANLRRAAALK